MSAPRWLAWCVTGCLAVAGLSGCDPPGRCEHEHDVDVALGSDGRSPGLRFEVPEGARSFTVVVIGDPEAAYRLGSFRIGGRELIDIGAVVDPGGSPEARSSTIQSPRAGTFTFVYPYAPDLPPLAGVVELRVASDRGAANVRVITLAPPDDGSRVLHVNLVAVTGGAAPAGRVELDRPEPFLDVAQAILGQAGLRIQVDSIDTLQSAGLSSIESLGDPWETPAGPLARLAVVGGTRAHNGALNLYLPDKMPRGVDGVSLGAPGPPLPSSHYFGIGLRWAEPAAMGRTLAHEIAHFLGLRHLRDTSLEGVTRHDPIDDTELGTGNLMEHGTRLTRGQIEVLVRSPLLRPE